MENLGILQAREKLLNREITSVGLTEYYFSQIEKKDNELNAFLTLNRESAVKEAQAYDSDRSLLESKKLGGIPLAVKDVFTTKNLRTTCASMILDNYVPVYESTPTRKVLEEGAIFLGKTNLDQFCHGSSTVTSAYGATRNPYDTSKVPGGSSGGSAAAVAADMTTAALGTETAGSIRLPASWTNIVGMKPTYGRVSRFGVLAMGSSLDSPGPMTKNVEDAAYLLGIMAGHDANDFTSSNKPTPDYYANLDPKRIKGLKLGLPVEYMELDLSDGVRKRIEEAIVVLKDLGAEIVNVRILDPKYSIATYTLVCRSEVSSNLARYDGTRYDPAGEIGSTYTQYFESTRGEGFGNEPKRRVMTGTYALSAGYADKYYKKAEAVRQLIIDDLQKTLKEVDLIIGPATPTTALTDDEALNNPLFGEMADVLAEGSSLSGMPGISVPAGFVDKLPIGLGMFGRHFDEQLILDAAYAYQQATAE
jgi:aspartyl-tRNA(Asn)/glutamyl-tRNA(Gln) amidotransferase subunit A